MLSDFHDSDHTRALPRKTFLQITQRGNTIVGIGGAGSAHVWALDRIGDLGIGFVHLCTHIPIVIVLCTHTPTSPSVACIALGRYRPS